MHQRRINVPPIPPAPPMARQLDGPLADDPYIGKTFFSNSHAYTIRERIAMGGMGSVYTARHNIRGYPESEVAVKFIGNEMRLDPSAKRRFVREAKTMEAIDHPNVVKILDFGENAGNMFLVAEYIKGPSLRWITNRYVELPPEYAAAILLHVCMGLGAVHEKGIIYRDMKPDNIICLDRRMSIRYDQPMLKIIDFGAVKVESGVNTTLTQTGNFVGTIYYMAPEQFEREYDYRVDVYGTGVLAYELFTGKLPFMADSFPKVMKMHCEQNPVPPSAAAPGRSLPPGMDDVIMRALAKDPDERFQSMGELAQAISACWHSEEISVTNAHTWMKTAVAVAAVVAVTAAGLLLWTPISDAYRRHVDPSYNAADKSERIEIPEQVVESRHRPAHIARPHRKHAMAGGDSASDTLPYVDTTYTDTTYETGPSE